MVCDLSRKGVDESDRRVETCHGKDLTCLERVKTIQLLVSSSRYSIQSSIQREGTKKNLTIPPPTKPSHFVRQQQIPLPLPFPLPILVLIPIQIVTFVIFTIIIEIRTKDILPIQAPHIDRRLSSWKGLADGRDEVHCRAVCEQARTGAGAGSGRVRL